VSGHAGHGAVRGADLLHRVGDAVMWVLIRAAGGLVKALGHRCRSRLPSRPIALTLLLCRPLGRKEPLPSYQRCIV
jgi:hypothetical protein